MGEDDEKCPHCRGNDDDCSECDGTGYVPKGQYDAYIKELKQDWAHDDDY